MNVAHQFQEIGIFPTQDGLITILKQMAKAAVTGIVGEGIAGLTQRKI
jgi:hypothetical protein